MAEIEMERRPKRGATKWIVLLLVIAAVAVAAWVLFGAGGALGMGSEPAAETPAATEPATPIRERPMEDGDLPPAEPVTDPAPSDTLPGTGAPAPAPGAGPRPAA